MSLNQEQTEALRAWVQEGHTLADIQKRLETEFDLRITYMDLRFMVDDLDLEVAATGPKFDDPKPAAAGGLDSAPGKVSVALDKISRPDALVSGQVTFSDGMTAQWSLDQAGRLSLDPKQPDYRPSQEDLQSFQTELSEAVRKSGLF
ncbi:MAG: hypothetical protein AB3N64_09785 [Puniceicoccaceae bacterium]